MDAPELTICYDDEMTKQALAELLEQVSTWSEHAQQELVRSIIKIESRHGAVYRLADEEREAVNLGLADIQAGRIVSDEEVIALFNRYFP
ncbi:MAG: hypothetical protein H7312_14020 [Tardiphaga sp.]|nr:hypothetical protein [Tardiphaga sp.]